MGDELYPCESGNCLRVVDNGDGYVKLTADGGDGTLYVPRAEFDAFVERIRTVGPHSPNYRFELRENAPAVVVKGQRYVWKGVTYRVVRVSDSGNWADIRVDGEGGWSKRQPLPLPVGSVLVGGA